MTPEVTLAVTTASVVLKAVFTNLFENVADDCCDKVYEPTPPLTAVTAIPDPEPVPAADMT